MNERFLQKKVYHPKEGLPGSSYITGTDSSFYGVRKVTGEEYLSVEVKDIMLLFLIEGKIKLSYNAFPEQLFEGGRILLIPPTPHFNLSIVEDTYMYFCVFDPQERLSEDFSLEMLLPYLGDEKTDEIYTLELKYQLLSYLTLVEAYLVDDIFCAELNEIKKKEVFYLFQMYYRKEELAAFFQPILNQDILFKEKVLKNVLDAHNVAELANLMHYSVSGFKKKFERNFGQPVYSWMQERRSTVILKELKENKKTIKEIVMQYGFSSQPRFYEFCKRHYGQPPGDLRVKR
jgi:AraC-like DNA-binding protein